MAQSGRDVSRPAQDGSTRGWTPLRSAIAVGIAAALLSSVALLTLPMLLQGRALPRVTIDDVPVGFLTEQQIRSRIATQVTGTQDVVLRNFLDGRTWRFAPEEVGLPWTVDRLTEAALAAGRDGGPLSPVRILIRGRDVTDGLTLDGEVATAALQELAPAVDKPPQDAQVEVVDGEVVEIPPELGQQLDIPGTLENLRAAADDPTQPVVDIALGRTAPRVFSDMGVAEAYEQATDGPLVLRWRDGREWTADEDLLTDWFSVETREGPDGDPMPVFLVDRDAVREWVEDVKGQLDQPPRNARFRWDPRGTTLLRGAQPGLTLDVPATVDRIIDEVAFRAQRIGEPVVDATRPRVGSDALASLQGMRDLGVGTVSIAGMPSHLVTNMLAAVDRLNGIALRPGDSLVVGRHLEPLDRVAGFEPQVVRWAPDGWLVGGVEWVTTAGFRAAFWSGLAIDERHPPPYRIGWLEPPVGMDAAVIPGERELKIRNDTARYVLHQVEVDARRGALIWSIYGFPTGRRVAMDGPDVSSTPIPTGAAAEPQRRLQDGLPAGTTAQVAWRRQGASVELVRRIEAAGDQTPADAPTEQRFESRYPPTTDMVLVGTGPTTTP